MNQEKIMKLRMWVAVIVAFGAIATAFIFAGLYSDEKAKVRLTYIDRYEYNLAQTADEIEKYLSKKTDYDIHYNMIVSDMGAARAFVFLIDDYAEEQKTINELYYCFVKYPVQMKEKLEQTGTALTHITEHLDKGYDEVREIVDSIEKLGT